MGEEAVNKRVGILTWHYNNNFGSTLQAFALQEALKKIGYNPIFIKNFCSNFLPKTFGFLEIALEKQKKLW